MYLQPTTLPGYPATQIARSGGLDALIALDRIGVKQRFGRNQEIYAEGDAAGAWYKVVSGTVRVGKFLADGRRHIADFCFAGDSFGMEDGEERDHSAEAIGDAVVTRYSRAATERAIDDNPALSRWLRDVTLKSLAAAQRQMLLLGRMTAHERVASFLLDMAERVDAKAIELPMSRLDIADHLGLTIETVCRVLSDMKRSGIVTIHAHWVEIQDRQGLEALAEE